MRDHAYSVYILASERNGTLYVGVTNDLAGARRSIARGSFPASRANTQ
jgi:predicted GIY-YIG superfamily endonuclease